MSKEAQWHPYKFIIVQCLGQPTSLAGLFYLSGLEQWKSIYSPAFRLLLDIWLVWCYFVEFSQCWINKLNHVLVDQLFQPSCSCACEVRHCTLVALDRVIALVFAGMRISRGFPEFFSPIWSFLGLTWKTNKNEWGEVLVHNARLPRGRHLWWNFSWLNPIGADLVLFS